MTSWVVLFITTQVLVALSVGCALVAAPRLLPLPAAVRFLSGFALAPQLTGFVVLMAFASAPGLSWSFVHGLLLILSIVGLVAGVRPTFRRGRRSLRALGNLRALPQLLALLAVMLLVGYVVSLLAVNAAVPLIAFDALQYAREAALLGDQRDIAAWVGHAGLPDGSFRGDIHHPVYSSYLAWAQRFADIPGPLQDQSMRWALQATFLTMLVALPVAGMVMRWGVWSLATLPLVLLVPQMDYISSSASRDAFRIVPVVLLLAVLLRLGLRASLPHASVRFLPALTALSMFSLTAHTLNGFVLVCLLLGWLVWALLAGARWNLLPVGLACALGAFLGCWTYADAWTSTGYIQGRGVFMYPVLEGTPMLDMIRQLELDSLKGVIASGDRLQEALQRDGRGLAKAGVFVSLVVVALSLFQFRRAIRGAAAGISLMALLLALPVLGAFDLAGHEVSQWFVTNLRYALHWYVFLALALMAAAEALLGHCRPGRAVLAVAVVFLCLWTYDVTLRSWARNVWPQDYVERRMQPVLAASAAVTPYRLVLEDARWNYYLGNRHAVMYSLATRPLFIARTDAEFDAGMARLGAAGFMLVTQSLEPLWLRSSLAGYLERNACRVDLSVSQQTLFLLRANLGVKECGDLARLVARP